VKEPLSAIAIGVTFVAFYPYVRSLHAGTTKPHVFSWIIWAASTLIVFFAQLTAGGGQGAWPTGVSGMITVYVALVAFLKRTDASITRADWAFFVAALSSLLLWHVASDPLWAVVLLTGVDLLGFGPTFRKAYWQPRSESLWFYALIPVRNLIAALALERYSLTTLLFPLAVAAGSSTFVAMVLLRRRALARAQTKAFADGRHG